MKQSIKVALLGATGKAGKYLLKELLKKGYDVKALIRKPENFHISHPLLEVIEGDIKDFETSHLLLRGCRVVISAIGPAKGEQLIASLSTINILKVMKELEINRYISLAGLNLDIPGDQKNAKNQASSDWMRNSFPDAVADRQLAYEILNDSKTDWTLVRLPWIEQTEERRGFVIDLQDCLGEKISTTDLADFVIEQITDTTYFQKAPFVASL